jgi:glycosyltransferase involved in cell wall biosynthesis
MKLRIAYSGLTGSQNSYTQKMSEAFSSYGEVADLPAKMAFVRAPLKFLRKYDVVVFNWIENKIVNQKGGWSPLGVLKLAGLIVYGKLLARKTIFVRHNNYPHAAAASTGEQMRKFLDHVEILFDDCVTHSGHNSNERRKYVPHPLYHDRAPEVAHSNDVYFVVFGRIERYKGIHELIKSYTLEQKLVIAGPCHDPQYKAELIRLCDNRNIDLRIGFLSDDEASALVANSLGLLLSHSGKDMIATGSYFFAAGLGIPVFAVETPFLKWLATELQQPGIHLAENPADLANHVSTAMPPNRGLIRDAAQLQFGPASVERALKDLLSRKNK